jgi:hypothetical protein
VLHPEHLVGRGPQCTLRLDAPYVSAQHAVIRWNGAEWQVLDRASRNGTRLDGRKLEPGRFYDLEQRCVLSFGHPDECWSLFDASEPAPLVTCIDNGATIRGSNGVITVPSTERARCSLFRVPDGTWRIEIADSTPRAIFDGEEFELDGRRYRLFCPMAVGTTYSRAEGDLAPVLELAVSRDEEYVELSLKYADRVVPLGSRSHNYLLLVLARARHADESANLPAGERGWMYKAQLADALGVTPQQVDGDVFRIRAHFGQHGIAEAASIIERRRRTTQLRLGLEKTLITTTGA